MTAPTLDALVAVMREVTSVGKTGVNTNQGFKFRGIDEVLNKVGPAFREHRITVLPHCLEREHSYREGRNSTLNHWVVRMRYELQVPEGEVRAVEVYGEAMDAGDKGLAKAMSVAYRTALIQLLALPTGEPDPDTETYEIGQQEARQEPRTGWYGTTVRCDSPEEPTVGAPTVTELRKQIINELQGNRSPAWTLEEIAADFKSRTREEIREASAETLQKYLDGVRR